MQICSQYLSADHKVHMDFYFINKHNSFVDLFCQSWCSMIYWFKKVLIMIWDKNLKIYVPYCKTNFLTLHCIYSYNVNWENLFYSAYNWSEFRWSCAVALLWSIFNLENMKKSWFDIVVTIYKHHVVNQSN